MTVSIIIPTYNEEKRIISTLNIILSYFKSVEYDFEIIIINDGSTDTTKDILKDLINQHNNIIFIDNKINKGKGYAVKIGVEKAKYELILMTDADLSTPIKEFETLLKYINTGYDIVIGSRRMKNSKIILRQPLHRRIIGKCFGFLVKLLVIDGFKDTQCGFKLFKASIAKKIFKIQKMNGFIFDVEIIYLAKKKFNFKIKETPVTWENEAFSSKVIIKKEVFKMLKDLLKIRFIH